MVHVVSVLAHWIRFRDVAVEETWKKQINGESSENTYLALVS